MDVSFLKPKFYFDKTIRIVITGGGSGGHTFPLIAVYRELKKMAEIQKVSLEVIYIGPDDFTLPYILKEEGIKVKTITVGKLRGSSNFIKSILGFFKIIGGIFQSLFQIYALMPDVIFSKGGYGSFPVVFWGILFFIPTYAHESDAVPGLVNHMVGRFCKKVFISFDYTKKYFSSKKTLLTGNPIRFDLFNQTLNKKDVKKLLDLDEKKPVVTIIGGSQGSRHINDFILDILPKIIKDVEVIHQTGKINYEKVKREADVVFQEIIGDKEQQKYYHPLSFFEETATPSISSLKDIFAVSDLIIARAGSGLIFEIAASGKPSILIPLPWASRGHQKRNAYEYAKNEATVVIEEGNLKPNVFSDLIIQIVSDKKKKEKMSQAALEFAKPKAAHDIAQHLLQIV
ncbi:MAG TPA: UDP-N-acetylglucosamine--N-acetylmuramyl-(pentapeptide) pyrophosphoryl-undecaprenol N-acetylglucosamine transferase [Candidatus Paceibacterota bacterium]|nr:UDP-N-acetylglucosamine--N-acetylmuramyl-(pentapeptide) pyrophosphoryl-undecaprenol N-acetylglucosamine transferase [Candidatus Paceibacterota bacterium]